MFINSRVVTIGKYRDVPVYSRKMSWYSGIFRDIRDIPGFHNARQTFWGQVFQLITQKNYFGFSES
jgi:hypothetical protein